MASLVIVIILNVFILTVFRLLSHFLVNTYQTILVNYWTCAFISFIILGSFEFVALDALKSWIWFALILGGIFVLTFYLIAKTTQTFDVSIASLASKVSLIIPVSFSLLVLKSYSHTFDALNYLGLMLTLVAIILSGLSGGTVSFTRTSRTWALPFSVFLLSGIIDASLNYANLELIQPADQEAFIGTVFFSAAFTGTIISAGSKKRIDRKAIPWGILLGIINIFSVFFLLKALDDYHNDGAFVFPVVSIGIIIIATIVSLVIFKDKVNKFKLAGLIMGVVSLLLIAHQELFDG